MVIHKKEYKETTITYSYEN